MNHDEAVRSALGAANAPGIPEGYRDIVFREVLRASLSAGRSAAAPHATSASQPADQVIGESPAVRLASRWNMPVEQVSDLFDFSEDGVKLGVEPRRLAASKAGATEQIAYLICAARQGGLGEAETSMETIRLACQDYGKYDPSNFAASLKPLAGSAFFGGTARARTYKLNRAGFDRARDVAMALQGR